MAPKKSSDTRILLITRAHSTESGGMERLSAELFQVLQNLPDIKITIIAHKGPRWLVPLFMLKAVVVLLFQARQADVVHLGDPLLSFLGWIIKKTSRVPVSVTVHGLDITFAHPLYQCYLAWFFNQFDSYIAISFYVQQLLAARGLASRTTIINPATTDRLYDPSILRESINEILGETGTTQNLANQILLFTAGRLVARKGHVWFIKNVLPTLPENTHYLIAGDGPQRDLITVAAKDAGVQDRVHILGRVSRQHLKILYNVVDIFVQPSIRIPHDAEGFGLVLLEAALCERPIFAAGLEGITDAIHNGQNGHLLPSGEAVLWQRSLSAFIAQSAFRSPAARTYTLQVFSWQRAATQHAAIWRTLSLSRPR